MAALVAGHDGTLLGTSSLGGTSCATDGCGVVFSLARAGTKYRETVLYNFKGGTSDGEFPEAPLLIQGANVFGTTARGGSSNCGGQGCGVVFELSPSKSGSGYIEKILYAFSGRDGWSPNALIADANGTIYGTTKGGGDAYTNNGDGTVFELKPSSATGYIFRTIHKFTKSDGSYPSTSLLIVGDALYGTTILGGQTKEVGCAPIGCGTVFSLKRSGSGYTERVTYAFRGGSDGARPQSPLVTDRSGKLYGTTDYGGSTNCEGGCGTVFLLEKKGSRYEEKILYRFMEHKSDRGDGVGPAGALAYVNGKLYGETASGGAHCHKISLGCGSVFSIVRAGTHYVKKTEYSFEGGAQGFQPNGGVLWLGGELFGAAYGGNTGCSGTGCGLVFELKP